MQATKKMLLVILLQQVQCLGHIQNYVLNEFEQQSNPVLNTSWFRQKSSVFFQVTALRYFCESMLARDDVPKSSHWYDFVLPNLNERDFIVSLRMPRQTLACLYKDLNPFYPAVPKSSGSGNSIIPFLRVLCITLHRLGHRATVREVASKFGVGWTTVSYRFPQVIDMIIEVLGPRYLKWPSLQRQKYIANKFLEKAGVMGVVGLVDGSHVPVNLLDENLATDLYCRKGYYSVVLQATVDHVPLYTDVYVGWPGSVNDGRVWRNSPLKRELDVLTGNPAADPDLAFPNAHLLGGAAYPRELYMIPPFKNTGRLRHKHRRFNKRHSSTRMGVERSYGMLKGRFKTLKWLNYGTMELNCKVIVACCILHNYIMLNGVPLNNDETYEGQVEDRFSTILAGTTTGEAKRQRMMDYMMAH